MEVTLIHLFPSHDASFVEAGSALPLAGGESATVSFEEAWGTGAYRVDVGGLTETFMVSKEPVRPFWVRPGCVAGVLIVCDDGSVDLTGDIAEAIGAVVVRHDVSKKGLRLCVGCWWLLVLSVTVFTIAGF